MLFLGHEEPRVLHVQWLEEAFPQECAERFPRSARDQNAGDIQTGMVEPDLTVRVFGGVKPGATREEGLRVLEAAAAVAGPGIILDHAGVSRQLRREGAALTVTLGFAVVLIYLVLAAQFQSFRDPLIVLLGSVPLAISGALVFSFLDLTTINIYSQVGLITLAGLIAKNGILIVEFANTLQARGRSKAIAIREASLTRLRPVMMTSAATVFGHLPLVLVAGSGAEARNSIGTILVAGMVVGTLFTLFVVPVFYSLIAAQRRPGPVPEAIEDEARAPATAPIATGIAWSGTRGSADHPLRPTESYGPLG